jgi:anti-sigma regulatory factor (Ser/Thr protein kinase)
MTAFERQGSATAETASEFRQALAVWLSGYPMGSERQADVVLAVYEAMINAVEHAYLGDLGGKFEVRAARRGSELDVTVTDHGTWRPPDPSVKYRGRGLVLIGLLSDANSVSHADTGTTVSLTWHLGTVTWTCRLNRVDHRTVAPRDVQKSFGSGRFHRMLTVVPPS